MKKVFYLSLALFLILIINASINKKGFFNNKSQTYSNLKREPYVKPKQINTTLIISYSGDNIVSFETKADEGDSVFNLLRTVAAKEGIEIEVKEYDFGTLVESVNGYANSKTKSWIYFVNDTPGNVGADQKIIEDGDKVEWKYIEPIY